VGDGKFGFGGGNDECLECRMTMVECRMVEVASLGLIEKVMSAEDRGQIIEVGSGNDSIADLRDKG